MPNKLVTERKFPHVLLSKVSLFKDVVQFSCSKFAVFKFNMVLFTPFTGPL